MTTPETDHPEVVHETSDVNVRAVLGFGAGLVLVAIVVQVAMAGLFTMLDRQAVKATPPARFPMATGAAPTPAGPLLQANPSRDLKEFRAHEDLVLQQYGWIDRQAGIVQIPIDRAMEILARRGLPTRKPQPAGASK